MANLAELTDACGDDPTWVCRRVFDVTSNEALADVADFVVDRPLRLLLVVLIAWAAARAGRAAVSRSVRRLARFAEQAPVPLRSPAETQARLERRAQTLTVALRGVVTAAVWIVAFYAGLSVLGLDLRTLTLGTAIVGGALGFGAQAIVRDVLSGFFLLVEDQAGVGDDITVGGVSGKVERISVRTTRVRDDEGTVWHLANGDIRAIGNRSQGWARAVLDVHVAVDEDVDRARRVLLEAAARLQDDPRWAGLVMSDPKVLGVEDVSDDRYTLRLTMRTTPGDQWTVSRALRERVLEAFRTAGVRHPGAPAPVETPAPTGRSLPEQPVEEPTER